MSSGPDLNSLSRFRKQAGRLILEEHGHCEVPAGCGGVVLRWRNPLSTVPIIIRVYSPARLTCFLDGAEVRIGMVDLAPGRHAFTFVLEDAVLSAGLIVFSAVRFGFPAGDSPPSAVVEVPLQLLSAADGSWKCVVHEPPTEDWKLPTFDDREWSVLTRTEPPQLDSGVPGAYLCRECVRLGASFLRLPTDRNQMKASAWWQRLRGVRAPSPAAGCVWIRKVFEVQPPQFREQ
jgi:hypothetical protein